MDVNARMNALMNETLNVSGALLVKIFSRAADENQRFSERAGEVRDLAVHRVDGWHGCSTPDWELTGLWERHSSSGWVDTMCFAMH